jgi:hypothetical protein
MIVRRNVDSQSRDDYSLGKDESMLRPAELVESLLRRLEMLVHRCVGSGTITRHHCLKHQAMLEVSKFEAARDQRRTLPGQLEGLGHEVEQVSGQGDT